MKNFITLFCLLFIALGASAGSRGKVLPRMRDNNKTKTVVNKSAKPYESVNQLNSGGKISTDSVIDLALYHKAGNPELAEKYLKLVADNNPRAAMELGVMYAFSPQYKNHASEGLKLLQSAVNAGYNEANEYLGLYYFNHKDYAKAKACFEACRDMKHGVGNTAMGSMYLSGTGVSRDAVRAREYFRRAALEGYARGAALYGFNLRASDGVKVDYPDSFFWLYIAGDLGDDAARTALFLPRRNENRGDSETAKDALSALQWIGIAQTGKNLKNEPIYKDGFLPSLKTREKEAEQGDDWARFYLGSMNYNGDFLNQNYKQAFHYYEPIARNGKLPKTVLALVNERLSEMYRDGKGTNVNAVKAQQYARAAAHCGSLSAYKAVERISK